MTGAQEITERPKSIMKRKRLISFGADYGNEEFDVSETGEETDAVRVQFSLCQKLNVIELHARENHAKIKRQWQELERAQYEEERRKVEKEERDLRIRILDIIKSYPKAGLSDIAGVLEITQNHLRNSLMLLEQEGKIKPQVCKRLYTVVENPVSEMDNDQDQDMET